MANPKVISREYKIMLRAERFSGDEAARCRTANRFWAEFRRAVSPVVINTRGELDDIGKARFIVFYDTASHRLNTNGYLFRERSDEPGGDREVTLKFRHPDGYLVQDRDMATGAAGRGDTKLEQDIKDPFQVLYSFSTKVMVSANKKLNRMDDPGRLFPGLSKKLDQYDKAEVIRPVGNFTAKEVVLSGPEFQVDERPIMHAKCGLIVWDKTDSDASKPCAVEFSFRYGDKSGDYSGDCAKRAYDAFLTLQKLSDWVDATSSTKTAYVYSLDQTQSK